MRFTGRRNTVLAVAALAAWSAGVRPAAALDPKRDMRDYIMDFWQQDSGLPQNFVTTLFQGRDGYIWIGTRGGLARFDGVRFTVYDDRHPRQLKEAEVFSLADAPDGSLWIGTHGGGLSRLKDGEFTHYTTKEGLPSDIIPALATTSGGAVWIGTQKGLSRLENGRITTYGVTDGLPSLHIQALYVDADGVLWIGTTAGVVSWSSGRFTNHARLHPGVLDQRAAAVTSDGQGGLWIGNIGSTVPLVRLKDGVATPFSRVQAGVSSIVGISLDPQGTTWLASLEGLLRHRDGRFEKYAADISKIGSNHTIQTTSLRRLQTILADREGSVWVGMPAEGLARLRDAVFMTEGLQNDQGMYERVSAVFQDRRGAMWMARDNGGIARLHEGQWQVFDETATTTRSIDTFIEDGGGTVWAGNEDRLYRLEGGRFRPVEGSPAEAASSVLAADGTLWFGSKNSGVFRYRDGRFTQYSRGEGLPGAQVRGLALDSGGALWMALKDGGVARLRDGAITTFGEKEGLPSLAASAILVDSHDVVWAATRRGLCRIQGDRVTVFTAENGLPANYFYQILEDGHGHLWLSHGRGVARVSQASFEAFTAGRAPAIEAESFGTESGIKSTAMVVPNQPAAWKGSDGRLWFATGRGATVVDPADLARNAVPPPVWVEGVRADKKSYFARQGIAFPPGDGEVEIEYTGLSFVDPRRMEFRYRLEGFDSTWIDAGTRRVAYYTNLPPGVYRFVVKASNNDGLWNETGRSFEFRLTPHWYQTEWFRIAAIGIVGLALLGAHRWRLGQHRRREKELAARVEEAIRHVKTLRGLLPICAGCKKIRDDTGYWNQMEIYIQDHSQADFSHSMCPECIERLYPDYVRDQDTQPSSN